MSACKARIPSYRHQKSRNLAVVRIDGHDEYFGPYGSNESKAKYDLSGMAGGTTTTTVFGAAKLMKGLGARGR